MPLISTKRTINSPLGQ